MPFGYDGRVFGRKKEKAEAEAVQPQVIEEPQAPVNPKFTPKKRLLVLLLRVRSSRRLVVSLWLLVTVRRRRLVNVRRWRRLVSVRMMR